jgi:hypothetical protein
MQAGTITVCRYRGRGELIKSGSMKLARVIINQANSTKYIII